MTTLRGWTRWIPLLMLAGILAACTPAVAPVPAAAPTPVPPPAARQATCNDSAIRLLDRGAGIHGAIVADTLHLGGATAPVTCAEPANQSVAGLPGPGEPAAQMQQSQYYLIVVRYTGGNRLYVISRRGDGTTCVVDTNDECVAHVSDLPEDFDLQDLPDDVAPTIPAGRAAPAAPVATDTAPDAAGDPHPRNEAAGVTVDEPLLSWSAGPRAASYDLYWGTAKNLAADAALGTPITTSYTAATIRRPGATAAERRLAEETTYYWRVDAKNDAGTTKGAVWSFTTAVAPDVPDVPGGGYTPPVVTPPGGGYTPPVVTPPGERLTVSIADASFTEGNGRLVTQDGYTAPIWEPATTRHSVPVRLSASAGPDETVRVRYSMADGTADGSDYVQLLGGARELYFRDGATSETIYVYLIEDLDQEEDETFHVELEALDGLTCGRCRATISIINDD